ncbi:cysteine-rich motor neuron 1 protein-like [Scleropages formosus]|uniref:cysteine-rich motor neuron 1 protein-like n=1 Tax=Scleropages formosus TaxID=113540 RepID=UPI0010FABBF0|nr:cysteine-rich motor neuron 1 protein-like [Scleropages formosus]
MLDGVEQRTPAERQGIVAESWGSAECLWRVDPAVPRKPVSCEERKAVAKNYMSAAKPEPNSVTPAPPASDATNNCTLSEANCIRGFHLDQNGCPTCFCQTIQAREPQDTSRRTSRRWCEVCHCKTCMEEKCDKACPGGLRLSNRCCFTCHCTDSSSASFVSPTEVSSCLSVDGHRHAEGEMWNDGCRQCYCHNGQEMCSLISCPATACATPIIQPGHCCPSCPRESPYCNRTPTSHRGDAKNLAVCLMSEGDHFAEGKTWSLDSCTQCICLVGKVLCETKTCPALLCQNPIRTQDSCCPQCPAEPGPPIPINRSSPGYCRDQWGSVFLEAQSWRLDPCSSCVCLDGAIKCFPESCPLVGCTKAVLHKGQCCPYCLGDTVSPAVCHFNGKIYADEERWNVDGCTHCYCLQGQTLCSTVSCPTPLCREPTQSGRCCPVCPAL